MIRRCACAAVGLLLAVAGCGGDGGGAGQPTATAAPGSATPAASATPVTGVVSPTVPPATPTRTATVTAAATVVATSTITATPTATATPTVTATPTASATPRPPQVTYFGVARADDLVQTTELFDAEGRPIFERVQGQGMTLVLEAARGSLPLAASAYDPFGGLPGAQFIVSRALGDGSLAVCDFDPPIFGGIPATTPLEFSDAPAVVAAINDLGCRVNDGTGVPSMRFANSACTRDLTAEFRFVDPASSGQFCLPITRAWGFPPGDTVVAARVQDIRGTVSEPREIVVRVAGEVPFGCEDGLGERAFTPGAPSSLTGGPLGSIDGAGWASEPLRLCGGPDLGDGVHALTLRDDAVIGVPLPDASTLCVRFAARGSSGSVDCDGGTAHDVRVSQETPAGEPIADTGLGEPAGAGALSLRVPIGIRQLPIGSSPLDCLDVTDFALEFEGALTTAVGVAEVVDATGTPVVSLSRSGAALECAAWHQAGRGTLVVPLTALGTVVGDVVAALVLSE